MKILILGAKGMLGNDLAEEFKEYNPTLWDKEELDIINEKKVHELIHELNPEFIINVAAYTDVEAAEDNESLANLINASAVRYIAKAAKLINAKILHISTEYVFSGSKQAGYNEDDKPEPLNAYGRSKFRGEQELISSGAVYYLVRTSWLYGKAPQRGKARGINFIATIINKAKTGEDLKVVDDQFGRPTFTKDLSQNIHYLIKKNLDTGIYHIVNEGQTSWYGLAQKALQLKGIDANIKPCATDEFPSKAQRPKYSILNNNRLPKLRNWEEALEDYLNS